MSTLSEYATRGRGVQLVQYGLVGGSGIPVDMAIVAGLLAIGMHHLVAQPLAWTVAMTWNFSLNWWFTFDRPDGSILRQWAGYGAVQLGALAVRVAVVAVLVDGLGARVLPATLVGILLPALAGFLVSIEVFEKF